MKKSIYSFPAISQRWEPSARDGYIGMCVYIFFRNEEETPPARYCAPYSCREVNVQWLFVILQFLS